jgi:CheY-like chemotaxis protein
MSHTPLDGGGTPVRLGAEHDARTPQARTEMPSVLVVEDELRFLTLLVEEFEQAGFRVVWAATGEDATWLMQTQPRLWALVTDIRLRGELSGWDVGHRFRELWPEAPVVYTSGYTEMMERPVTNSVFLRKPCRPAEIAAKIKQLC